MLSVILKDNENEEAVFYVSGWWNKLVSIALHWCAPQMPFKEDTLRIDDMHDEHS